MSDFQHLIDRYLANDLGKEEKRSFEQRLTEEPALTEALEMERHARHLVKLAGRRQLKAQLEALEEEEEEPVQKKKKRLLPPIFLAAASLAILVIAVYSLDLLSSAASNNPFDQYFEVYRSPVQLRSPEESNTQDFEEAIQFYQAKNYTQCIARLQKINPSQNSKPAYLIQFYLGMANLAQKPANPSAAIAAFEKVKNSENDYQQQAIWYQALAYLNRGDKTEAKNNLMELMKWTDYKYAEAKALLEGL